MRPAVLALVLLSSVSLPQSGIAQVYRSETPPPAVTAAGALWQLNGEPVFYAGAFYDPSGTTQFFDGKVMVRTGVYEGVPLYEDATRQPYSVVLVPIGDSLMRPYVRRQTDYDVRGMGSIGRTPYVAREVVGDAGRLTPAGADYALVPIAALERLTAAPQPQADQEFHAVSVVAVSLRSPATGPGLWIEFEGARWFSVGRAVDYDPNRFEPAGAYRGFPVYRERAGAGNRIFVTVVADGPLAPFERR
jgi:hypothetical protein